MAALDNYDVVKTLSPIINSLSNKTKETVDLAILNKTHMVLLDRVLGSYRLGVNSKVGLKLRLSTTASGKSALSLLDTNKAKAFLESENQQQRIKDVKKLEDEIAKAGINGVAYDFDENNDGISALGSSFIINKEIYSISIPVPSHRFYLKQKELERSKFPLEDSPKLNSHLKQVSSQYNSDINGLKNIFNNQNLDYDFYLDEIKVQFGEELAKLVDGLTNIKS